MAETSADVRLEDDEAGRTRIAAIPRQASGSTAAERLRKVGGALRSILVRPCQGLADLWHVQMPACSSAVLCRNAGWEDAGDPVFAAGQPVAAADAGLEGDYPAGMCSSSMTSMLNCVLAASTSLQILTGA